MKPKLLLCLAVVLSGGLFARIATAQPVYVTYESLELRVAQAQSIFLGTVSSCQGVFIERPGGYFGGYREDGARRPNGVMRYAIAVKVDQVLKGKLPTTVELFQETSADDKRFQQWAEHHIVFLWFNAGEASTSSTWSNLGGIDSKSNLWSTIRLSEPVPAESTYSGDPPIYRLDFTHVTDPKEILANVRKLAKTHINPSPIHKFKYIWSAEPSNPFASLLVPVSPPLEKLARRMILCPNEFMSRTPVWNPTNAGQRIAYENGIETTRNDLRTEGISALQYFKSKANIKLIKPFLTDPAFSVNHYAGGKTALEYYLRKAAFDTLQKWNIDVPKPILEEAVTSKVQSP